MSTDKMHNSIYLKQDPILPLKRARKDAKHAKDENELTTFNCSLLTVNC